MKSRYQWPFCLWITFITSCSLPPVPLTTPKPMQVDINMRVDVYQYAASTKEKVRKDPIIAADLEAKKNNRRTDLQAFKNAQYIGEGHEGLVIILNEPPSEFRSEVRKIVEGENAERMVEMQAIAQKEKISLSEVQKRQGEANRIRAFKGEWIENAYPDGTFKWVHKDSP